MVAGLGVPIFRVFTVLLILIIYQLFQISKYKPQKDGDDLICLQNLSILCSY